MCIEFTPYTQEMIVEVFNLKLSMYDGKKNCFFFFLFWNKKTTTTKKNKKRGFSLVLSILKSARFGEEKPAAPTFSTSHKVERYWSKAAVLC